MQGAIAKMIGCGRHYSQAVEEMGCNRGHYRVRTRCDANRCMGEGMLQPPCARQIKVHRALHPSSARDNGRVEVAVIGIDSRRDESVLEAITLPERDRGQDSSGLHAGDSLRYGVKVLPSHGRTGLNGEIARRKGKTLDPNLRHPGQRCRRDLVHRGKDCGSRHHEPIATGKQADPNQHRRDNLEDFFRRVMVFFRLQCALGVQGSVRHPPGSVRRLSQSGSQG